MKKDNMLTDLGKEYKIENVENKKIKGKTYKIIYIKILTKKVRCPLCNKFTNKVHDTLKPIKIKYLKLAEYNTYVVVRKRRFTCHECKKTFTENIDLNNKNKSISNKLEQKVLKDLLTVRSIKDIAQDNDIPDTTVRRILKNGMSDYPKYLKLLPSVISFDEFKADTNKGKYAFIVNDLLHKKTLDILSSRKKDDLINYFTQVENRSSVQYVVSDMYEPYLLVTTTMFPKAKYVVDRFHYTTYVMDALDDIRIRLQKEYGYNSKQYRLLKNKKNVTLLRKYYNDIDNWYTYTKRYKNGKIVEVLKIDILHEMLSLNDDLKRGYELKELFLDIAHHSTYENAKEQLLSWIELCLESKIEEMIKAAKTILNWLEYIVNSFIDERFSNGYTEGLNNKIKVIKRNGYGFKDFEFFRLRIMYILNGKIHGNIKKKV